MKVGVERKDDSGKAVLDLVPLRRPVTIEDLLLHTSGITYGFYGRRGPVKAAYDGIYLGDFDNAGFAERIAKVPLAEQPRTLWDYGHSIDVLGRVIEVASGQSLYQFEKSQLFDPLGMTTTKFFLTDPAERARYAQPLRKDRHVERNSLDVTRWESGGGGLVTTIADFARYGQMLLNGGALDGKTYLSPNTFAAMTTDHIGPGSGVARNYFYYPGDGFGFGYGFGVRTDPGNAVPPPPGSPGEIKWDGATGAYLVVDRAQDMFFIVLQNAPSGPPACAGERQEADLRCVRKMIGRRLDGKQRDAAQDRRERSGRNGDGAHRGARPRAHLHHAVGADPSFRRQLHPFRQWRQNALAGLRPRRAVQRQLLHGLHVPDLGPVRPRQPDPQGSGGLPARSRVAARHSLSGFDLRADADRLLSDLPALSSARHHRFQFLPFLVAHADGRALAVGTGMVSVGAAGARRRRRRAAGRWRRGC